MMREIFSLGERPIVRMAACSAAFPIIKLAWVHANEEFGVLPYDWSCLSRASRCSCSVGFFIRW